MRLEAMVLLLAAALASACRSAGPPNPSGFLGDYSRLRPDPEYGRPWRWEKPGVDMSVYDRLLIDPVVVELHPAAEARSLDARTLRIVADALHGILVDTVGPYYTVVPRRAPNVLRLRVAITDVRKERPGTPGSASIEALFLDAMSGERLAAVLDSVTGSESRRDTDRDVPKEWQPVRGAFVEWANQLLAYMDRIQPG